MPPPSRPNIMPDYVARPPPPLSRFFPKAPRKYPPPAARCCLECCYCPTRQFRSIPTPPPSRRNITPGCDTGPLPPRPPFSPKAPRKHPPPPARCCLPCCYCPIRRDHLIPMPPRCRLNITPDYGLPQQPTTVWFSRKESLLKTHRLLLTGSSRCCRQSAPCCLLPTPWPPCRAIEAPGPFPILRNN